jgi:hypothetical protein
MRTTTYLRLSSVFLLLAACGTAEKHDCNDGNDNDADGLIDEADPGCSINEHDREAPDPVQCVDGLDNDADTFIDAEDPGCEDAEDDEERDPTRACNDGVDNDEDGLTDFPNDPGCTNGVDSDEFNPAHCNDGEDNDGDEKIDWPFDPGCTSTDDSSEEDPVPPPACANGVDDDGDTFIDYGQDPGCSSAGDPDEFNTIIGPCGPSVTITDITGSGQGSGTITGPVPNELSSDVCNGYGGEFAFTYTVTTGPVALVVSTDAPGTTLDTVIYVRTECTEEATELGCNDDAPEPSLSTSGSLLVLDSVGVGEYYVIVDSFAPNSLGSFTLTVDERTPLGGACDPNDPDPCPPGLVCRSLMPGDPTTCQEEECEDGLDNDGDAIIDFPLEPGCDGTTDNTEVDPDPLPQCANGIDDDLDAQIDYPADPGCDYAADPIELDPCYPNTPTEMFDMNGITGSTAGLTGSTQGSCGGFESGERVYALTLTSPLVEMTLDTDNAVTNFDTTIYVRQGDCDSGVEIACNDSIGGANLNSSVTFVPQVGETYFVFVDGQWSQGSFQLDVSGVIPALGLCDPAQPQFACASGYACQESAPGAADWSCLVADCNDTVDNDADGMTDWPNDPGFATPSDDAEDFPNPITACSNGLDDDMDTLIDYTGGDPGCISAADNSELDECVPGQPVIDHPGGTMTGDTTGAPSLLSAPGACDNSATSGQSSEEVWVFYNSRAAQTLHFDTSGSVIDTILYVRFLDCAVPGPQSYCSDDVSGLTSSVDINAPSVGYYYAIVDGKWSGVGPYNITIYGVLGNGDSCTPGDVAYRCGDGYACSVATNTCVPSQCNDDADNDGDGVADEFDPGCADINDDDETNPAVLPACGNTVDDDGDGMIDYPADIGCTHAGDDNEQECAHDLCVTGVSLDPTCDPCVASICGVDPFCCDSFGSWDSICVGEVSSVCGQTCP